jgi:hypothetical protein
VWCLYGLSIPYVVLAYRVMSRSHTVTFASAAPYELLHVLLSCRTLMRLEPEQAQKP